jgi:hypothetical protein
MNVDVNCIEPVQQPERSAALDFVLISAVGDGVGASTRSAPSSSGAARPKTQKVRDV